MFVSWLIQLALLVRLAIFCAAASGASVSEPASSEPASAALFRPAAALDRGDQLGVALHWRFELYRFLTYCLGVALVIGGAGLALISYAEKFTASGVVVLSEPPSVVNAPAPGVVVHVAVREGDRVSAGQVLVQGRSLAHELDGVSKAEREVQSLEAQLKHLTQERVALTAAYVELSEVHKLQLDGTELRLKAAQDEADLAQQAYTLGQSAYARAAQLHEQRVVSSREMEQASQAWLDHQRALHISEQAVAQLMNEQTRLQAELEHQARLYAKERIALQGRELQFRAQLRAVQQQSAWTLIAPVAGVVDYVQVNQGETLRHGQPLLAISTLSDEHRVELWLAANQVSRVQLNQRTLLHYAGLTIQEHGLFEGRVAHVARVPILQGSQPMYKVSVAVTPESEAPELVQRPPPGLSVQADFIVSRKPLWQWLLEPLQTALARV